MDKKELNERVNKALDEHGISRECLTDDEIKSLEKEIGYKEKNGDVTTIDGFFSNPSLYYRKKKQ